MLSTQGSSLVHFLGKICQIPLVYKAPALYTFQEKFAMYTRLQPCTLFRNNLQNLFSTQDYKPCTLCKDKFAKFAQHTRLQLRQNLPNKLSTPFRLNLPSTPCTPFQAKFDKYTRLQPCTLFRKKLPYLFSTQGYSLVHFLRKDLPNLLSTCLVHKAIALYTFQAKFAMYTKLQPCTPFQAIFAMYTRLWPCELVKFCLKKCTRLYIAL